MLSMLYHAGAFFVSTSEPRGEDKPAHVRAFGELPPPEGKLYPY